MEYSYNDNNRTLQLDSALSKRWHYYSMSSGQTDVRDYHSTCNRLVYVHLEMGGGGGGGAGGGTEPSIYVSVHSLSHHMPHDHVEVSG